MSTVTLNQFKGHSARGVATSRSILANLKHISNGMARITGGTVQQQACMKEQFKKEKAAALQFFLQNIGKSTTPSGVSAVLRKKLEMIKIDSARCDRLADEAAKRAEERAILSKQHAKEMHQSNFTPEYLSSRLDMRPASPKTKALLYDGISHDRCGRYQYLRARYQKEPEEKFPFPLPTSWDYGWRLSQSLKRDTVKKSPYGHVSIVKNTFFNRTGVSFGDTPEPKPWYSC